MRLFPYIGLLLLLAGCSASSPASAPAATPSAGMSTEVAPLVVDLSLVDGSIFDATTNEFAEEHQEGSLHLAELLVPPAAIDGEYSLASLTAWDTVGIGRVDGRWFEPFMRQIDCNLRVEAAPIPLAEATYVLGTAGLLDSNIPSWMQETPANSALVSIQLQVFDNATQRDSYASVLLEFEEQLSSFDCSIDTGGVFSENEVEELSALFAAEASDIDVFDVGYPGRGSYIEQFASAGLYSYRYLVGDEILLTAKLGHGFGASEDDELDPDTLRPVLEAQIARLKAAGLG